MDSSQSIQIIRGRATGTGSEYRTSTFSGPVWGDPVLATPDVTINVVVFAPSGRTYWHRHEGGQVLLVTAGEGQVWARGGVGGRISVGDVVSIPAGVEHWHGATDETLMTHTAISLGAHEWLEEVSEDDYAAACARAVSSA